MTFIKIFPGKYSEINQCYSQQFYFGVMERDHVGGKPNCLSINKFLLDEGVVDLPVLTLKTHGLVAG